jgi:hypothetical protein
MFDLGDFTYGNVRIPCDLRWRRNGRWDHDTHHCGDVGHAGDIGYIRDLGNVGNNDIVGRLGDVGRVDVLRNVGNVRIVGNVRLRLRQYHGIIYSVLTIARPTGQQHTKRSTPGILRDRQSWGEPGNAGTDDDGSPHKGSRWESDDAHRCTCLAGFVHHGKHYPVTPVFNL